MLPKATAIRPIAVALALALVLGPLTAAAQEKPQPAPPPRDARDVTERIEPGRRGPGGGPEFTVEIYDETAPQRRAHYEPPPPRRDRDDWRYSSAFFLYATRELPESGLPQWARWTMLPFAAALDLVCLAPAAVAGFYGS